ncbi:MAG: glycosyltransferase family 4 protein [Bacillota bacterium]
MYRILFITRSDLERIPAGDTIQIKSLVNSLEKRGLKIDLSYDSKPDHGDYDLVHCFNILRIKNVAPQIHRMLDRNIPLIITPIYWNMEKYLRKIKPEKISSWKKNQKIRGEILNYADIIAPNGWGEWEILRKDFSLKKDCRIIYNGVDSFFYNMGSLRKRHGIISVGRIHSRKNQLSIIKALRGLNIPLIFIGDVNDTYYYKKCIDAAEGYRNIRFHRSVGKYSLLKFYKSSKVHVLASWYDTPGLVNLEAGLAGCEVVTTKRGTAKEYLGNRAHYCEPENIKQIREVVLTAYNKVSSNELSLQILNNYTWGIIAANVEKIYSELLT